MTKFYSLIQFQLEMALIYDSLAAIYNAILDLTFKDATLDSKEKSSNEYLMVNRNDLKCKNFFKNRKNIEQLLHKFLRYVKFDGFTGKVEFSGNTYRQNIKIEIVRMTYSSEMSVV